MGSSNKELLMITSPKGLENLTAKKPAGHSNKLEGSNLRQVHFNGLLDRNIAIEYLNNCPGIRIKTTYKKTKISITIYNISHVKVKVHLTPNSFFPLSNLLFI